MPAASSVKERPHDVVIDGVVQPIESYIGVNEYLGG